MFVYKLNAVNSIDSNVLLSNTNSSSHLRYPSFKAIAENSQADPGQLRQLLSLVRENFQDVPTVSFNHVGDKVLRSTGSDCQLRPVRNCGRAVDLN